MVFDEDAMINILCLKNVRNYWPIDYDSQSGKVTVHTNRGHLELIMIEQGLHLYMPPEMAAAYVNAVAKNREGYNKCQLKGAQVAKELYAKLTFQSMKDFRWAVCSNQIPKCPVVVEDIDNAEKIYGKDVAARKGKTIRKKLEAVSRTKLKVCMGCHPNARQCNCQSKSFRQRPTIGADIL
jgi:hypothetical protein